MAWKDRPTTSNPFKRVLSGEKRCHACRCNAATSHRGGHEYCRSCAKTQTYAGDREVRPSYKRFGS